MNFVRSMQIKILDKDQGAQEKVLVGIILPAGNSLAIPGLAQPDRSLIVINVQNVDDIRKRDIPHASRQLLHKFFYLCLKQ